MPSERGKRREHMSDPHSEKFSGSEEDARRKVKGKPLDLHIMWIFILARRHKKQGGMSMFSIGEFSHITRVTPRQLRHYEELGLFRPERIDPETGYRFYSALQLPRVLAT